MGKSKHWIIAGIFLVVLLVGVGLLVKTETAKSGASLSRKNLALKVGETQKLEIRGTSKLVKWSSKNSSIATVSSEGIVKGISPGNTKVIAKASGKKLTCRVRVVSTETATPAPTDTGETPAPGVSATPPTATPTFYQFRYPDRLTEHYKKHGIEMGFDSEQAYLAAANAVIQNPNALHKLEAEDNDHVYFIEATGEIVFLSQDGFIRTYFIADRAYFERQGYQSAA